MASSDSSLQPFTTANVFSTILAVQLCQLTQPSGSLIFPGKAGLFWRSNPIASFLEACMIIRYISSSFSARTPGERSLSGLERISNVAYVLLLYRRGDLPSVAEIWTTDGEERLVNCMKADSGTSRWFTIGLITTIPEIATFVKLFGVSGVPILRTIVTCMVFAWLCVQLLQFSTPPTDELLDRLPHVQRTAESFRANVEAEQRFWKSCLAFLHLPLFGFLGYRATVSLSRESRDTLQWLNLLTLLYSMIGLVYFLVRYRYVPMPRTIAYLAAPGVLFNSGTDRNNWVTGRVVNFLLVFEITLVLYVGSIWEVFDDGVLKSAINFICFRRNLSDPIPSNIQRRMPSAANVMVTICIFTIYITTYDPEGTNKAGWTEWLG